MFGSLPFSAAPYSSRFIYFSAGAGSSHTMIISADRAGLNVFDDCKTAQVNQDRTRGQVMNDAGRLTIAADRTSGAVH